MNFGRKKFHLLAILLFTVQLSLFASDREIPTSNFNFGISYTNYTGFYNSVTKGNISSNDNYLGISCAYYLGEKFTFYIGANFNFLFHMVNTLDGNSHGIRVGSSVFGNISADIGIGVGYTFRFGKKMSLFLGGGIHGGLPHMRDSKENMFLAFNMGIDGKMYYRFYNIFYIGFDVVYDFLLIAPENNTDTFQGIGFIPAIGFVFDF